VPTLIAQKYFRPEFGPAVALEVDSNGSADAEPGIDEAVAVKSRPASLGPLSQ
jgi:hypothetical protein